MLCLPRETSLTPRSRSSPRHVLALRGLFCGLPVAGPSTASPAQAQHRSFPNPPLPRGTRCATTKFPERNPQRHRDADPAEGLWISPIDGFRRSYIERNPRNPRNWIPEPAFPSRRKVQPIPVPGSGPMIATSPNAHARRQCALSSATSTGWEPATPAKTPFHLAANLPLGRSFRRQPSRDFTRKFNQQPDRLRNHHACACI